jgi:hypothetical protein
MAQPVFDVETLNKSALINAFQTAEQFYLKGNPWDCRPYVPAATRNGAILMGKHLHDIDVKNSLSFGLSLFYRKCKAQYRLPDFLTITDNNYLNILVGFLQGPGNKDLASLKYLVVSMILNKQVGSHASADKK